MDLHRSSIRIHAGGMNDLVTLDADHPGFADAEYRERRNLIARLALEHRPGTSVVDAPYTEEEHAVWAAVMKVLTPLHESLACLDYRQCMRVLPLPAERIPQFSELNDRLIAAHGYSMLPVAGLVSARRFLEYLGNRFFLATQYIRHNTRPFYTPEPDVVHELIGHAVSFVHSRYSKLSLAFGQAAEGATPERIQAIERVYWYTLEFGVIREGAHPKAFGAGLLSGADELKRMATHAQLLPFDLEDMARRPYDPTGFQPVLYVADNIAQLDSIIGWLEQP